MRSSEEDFEVEELPAYVPCGEGDHVYGWIEKRDLTTLQAIDRLAAALGVAARDVGYAGLKDRRAVTRQQLSFPAPVTEAALRDANVSGVRVLEVGRHRNKLRTGHLRGNRFRLVLRGAAPDAAERARAILERLAQPPGCPNWYGEQRFGARGDNHERGRALVLGERLPGRPPRGRERRLLISAFQSHLFNRYLEQRIADELFYATLTGDVLRAGVPTGPIFGPKMPLPAPDSAAAQREQAVLDEAGIAIAQFARVGKLALGTRRPIGISLGETKVEELESGTVAISFQLPAGAYATAVMREVVKQPYPFNDPSPEPS